MPHELTNIRRALSKVSSELKQGRLISAATAVRDGARLFGRVSMIKNEAEEFSSLLKGACELLHYDREVAKIFPLAIAYSPGQESELAQLMNQLIEALQLSSTEDAIKRHNEKKAQALAKGRAQIEENRLDEARTTFKQITEDYADDAELAATVGEIFLMVGELADAHRYLLAAVKMQPDSAHFLNKLGIVLRKMKNFEQAESIYRKAIQIEPGDANLHFNMGRVYLDRQSWPQAIACAEKALSLDPEFAEAGKLASYARRKAAGAS